MFLLILNETINIKWSTPYQSDRFRSKHLHYRSLKSIVTNPAWHLSHSVLPSLCTAHGRWQKEDVSTTALPCLSACCRRFLCFFHITLSAFNRGEHFTEYTEKLKTKELNPLSSSDKRWRYWKQRFLQVGRQAYIRPCRWILKSDQTNLNMTHFFLLEWLAIGPSSQKLFRTPRSLQSL